MIGPLNVSHAQPRAPRRFWISRSVRERCCAPGSSGQFDILVRATELLRYRGAMRMRQALTGRMIWKMASALLP